MQINLKKNKKLLFNQLRLKLLYKNCYLNFFRFIKLNINLFRLKSFGDDFILESLFLIELISFLKGSIIHFKKSYQEVNIQLGVTLRKYYLKHFLNIIKIFYFPILKRRNILLPVILNDTFNFFLSLRNIILLPFLPDIFYKEDIIINSLFQFNSTSKLNTKLLLYYYNFPII